MIINRNGYPMIDKKINSLLDNDLSHNTGKPKIVKVAFEDWLKQNQELIRSLYEGRIGIEEFRKRLKTVPASLHIK